MKRKVFLTGVISMLLVLGLTIIGCDTGTNGGDTGTNRSDDSGDQTKVSTTGSVTVKNNSYTYRIDVVDIFDVDTDQSLKIDNDGIDKGKSKTYDIEPGNKLQVYIGDEKGFYYLSVQFSLKAGDSKTFTYDGEDLFD
jgi:hypothetical protein